MSDESNHPAPPPTAPATTSDEYQKLRSLLVRPERDDIDSLKRQLDERSAVDARSVAAVLPAAFSLASEQNGDLGSAMAPTIESALQTSVRRNPDVITEAIFPIIGSAITRAVHEALLRLLQQTSYALDHAFSLRGWRWRIEALATGKSFSEVVLLHSLVYRVEQVFLIHPESGLLLQHVIAESVAAATVQQTQDASMVTSMLTAIQDFVRDSFRVESKAALDSVEVGDLQVWLERGPHAVLACVIRGTAPVRLRELFRRTVELCHRSHSEVLKAYSGDTDDLKGVRPYLEACLQAQQKTEQPRPFAAWFVICVGLLVCGYFLYGNIVRERTRARRLAFAVESLRKQPGVVLLDATQKQGHFVLRLLRDPEAEELEQVLRSAGLRLEETESVVTPYLAMEPELVLRRARRALVPPDGVQLSFNITDGVLLAVGTASEQWIADAKLLVRVVVGVRSFDCKVKPLPREKTLYEVLYDRARIIEAIDFRFRAGSIELLPGQESQFQKAVTELKQLLALADGDRTGMNVTVEVHAHTDTIGDELYNLKLRESRAKVMSHWLASAGIDMRRLRPVVPLQFEQERSERATSFRVIITGGINHREGAR